MLRFNCNPSDAGGGGGGGADDVSSAGAADAFTTKLGDVRVRTGRTKVLNCRSSNLRPCSAFPHSNAAVASSKVTATPPVNKLLSLMLPALLLPLLFGA